jgi:hypothetical protein
MSSSDYLNVKKKLVLYNSLSQRSTNNTNISHSVSNSLTSESNRYYTTREEVNASNQVRRYEKCAKINNPDIFINNNICNVKLENNSTPVYALQTY